MELTLRQLMDVNLIPIVSFILAGVFSVCFIRWPKYTLAFSVAGTISIVIIESILFVAKKLSEGL